MLFGLRSGRFLVIATHYLHLCQKVLHGLALFQRTHWAEGRQILAQCPRRMHHKSNLSNNSLYSSLYHKLSISICRSPLPVKSLQILVLPVNLLQDWMSSVDLFFIRMAALTIWVLPRQDKIAIFLFIGLGLWWSK